MKHLSIFAIFLTAMLCMTGCKKQEIVEQTPTDSVEQTKELTVYASNLTDEASCKELDAIMETSGISKERRDVFWNHVHQFNECDGISGLTQGYETITVNQPNYDPYELQDAWTAAHPEFTGYNCRITSFTLMGDYISIDNLENPNTSGLFMDEQALQEDDSALFSKDDLSKFLALYSIVEGENTTDSSRQAQLVLQAWDKRGIHFEENIPMSMISIFFHNQYAEEENELLLGHTGILFDTEADGLYFVEKLAFQAPYQLTKFDSREELKNYLMSAYDVEWNQPTASPFIMENDHLL